MDSRGESASLRTSLLCLLLVLALLVRYVLFEPAAPLPFAAAGCHDGSPILIGTHHKTGTVLLQHIFKDVCHALAWRCSFNNRPYKCGSAAEAREQRLQLCLLQHGVRFKLPPRARNRTDAVRFRFVHAIRDPLEVVVSGYMYHLRTTEAWANRPERRYNGSTYRRYLGAMSVSDGLVAETKHSLRDALKTMPRLLNRTAGRPCALTLRLEDFEAGWEAAVSRLFDLIGVTDPRTLRALTSLVARHNVYARSRGKASAAGGAPYNRHVSGNASAKDELRAQLVASGAAFERIQRVRAVLGYPAVGKEGRSRARAHVARRPTA